MQGSIVGCGAGTRVLPGAWRFDRISTSLLVRSPPWGGILAGCIKNWVVRMVSGSCVWRFWGLRNFRINKLILKLIHFKDLAGAVRHTQIFG